MEVILGTIVGVFGVHGEVKVKSNTDFAKLRYKKGNEVTLYSPIKQVKEKQVIASYKENNKGLDIVSFKGKDNPDLIEKYIGYQILIDKPEKSLSDDLYYYADIWHCMVYYNDEKIGEVIDMFDGGSHLILRIKREEKKDILYPFVDKFIKHIDIENKKIYLNPIGGMID